VTESDAIAYDPITFSVILSRFNAIVEEMTVTLERSAWTSILALCHDYSCGIYDAVPRQVSMYDALPVHTTSMQLVVQEIARSFDGDIHEGDVFLCNDPYSRNTHIGDLVTALPVFVAGRLLFWSVTKGHQLDVGGYLPSSVIPQALNVWQEGLTIPPLRLVEGGRMRADILRMYLANVRYAELLEGDLRAQIGSIEKGRQRLEELCADYGPEVVLSYVDHIIAYADRRMSVEVEAMPDGVYTAEGWIDSDGIDELDIPIRVTITIDGDRISVDYTGSAPQMKSGANGTEATSLAAGAVPFLYYIDPDIPHNQGCIDHIDVIAPKGSITNAVHPASTSVATILPSEVMQDVINKALAGVMPEKVSAGGARNANTPIISGGEGPDGWGFALLNSAAGGGAVMGNDGWPLFYNQASLGGMKILPVEQMELLYPLRIEQAEIETDSMGAGTWIGGTGVRMRVRSLEGTMTVISSGDGCANPPHGILGGTAGIGGGQYVEHGADGSRLYVGAAGGVTSGEADVWVSISSGGGGYGDPFERDAERVRRDVRDGLVSRETALDAFGVVLDDAADPILDVAATAARRALPRPPRPALFTPSGPSASTWVADQLRPDDSYLTTAL
jgi:N-methylhydantoinase B